MPEWAEIKISSDFINEKSNNKIFSKLYDVERGNNAILNENFNNFSLSSSSFGKELLVYINNDITIHIFMGMSGGLKYLPTEICNSIKFTRLRFDNTDGYSLILYGGFLGPKYNIGKPFTGVKRGPDPVYQHNEFIDNVLSNLHKKIFDKPIYEVLLDQKYFNGIGNYLRSTILFYLDKNPFASARDVITNYPEILSLCREIPLKAYDLNGGQLKDWENPFIANSSEFDKWVFYQKGKSLKDSNNRTFWYNEKW